jgi:ADP-heptose:LPS heptosyltransferase
MKTLSQSVATSIDRILGQVLCAFFTLIRPLLERKKSKEQESYLFIHCAEMGGLILAAPLIEQLMREKKEAKFYLLTFGSKKDCLKALDLFEKEHVFFVNDASLSSTLLTSLKALWKMRKAHIQTVIDFELFSRYSTLMSFLSGAQERLGYKNPHQRGLYRGELLTKSVSYKLTSHITQNYQALMSCLEADYRPGPLKKTYPRFTPFHYQFKESEERLQGKLHFLLEKEVRPTDKILVVNAGPGPSLAQRAWPKQSFVSLLTQLQNEKHFDHVVFTGHPVDRDFERELIQSLPSGSYIPLTGKTSFEEMLVLFRYSELLITNDCGAAHIAAMVKCKSLIFWGPEAPEVFAPLGPQVFNLRTPLHCSPCLNPFNYKTTDCMDNQCLQQITVAQAYEAVLKTLVITSEQQATFPAPSRPSPQPVVSDHQ